MIFFFIFEKWTILSSVYGRILKPHLYFHKSFLNWIIEKKKKKYLLNFSANIRKKKKLLSVFKQKVKNINMNTRVVEWYIPLGVHVENDGLIAGGVDDRPEAVLVDLGDLPDGGTQGLQAWPNTATVGPSPLWAGSTTEPQNHILLRTEAAGGRRRRESDLLLCGAG